MPVTDRLIAFGDIDDEGHALVTDRVPRAEIRYDENTGTYCRAGEPFSGTACTLHADGSPATETEFRDGLQWGVGRSWHRNGRLATESELCRDVLHGTAREWDETGRLRSEIVCEYGITIRETAFDADGRVVKDYALGAGDPDAAALEHRSR